MNIHYDEIYAKINSVICKEIGLYAIAEDMRTIENAGKKDASEIARICDIIERENRAEYETMCVKSTAENFLSRIAAPTDID